MLLYLKQNRWTHNIGIGISELKSNFFCVQTFYKLMKRDTHLLIHKYSCTRSLLTLHITAQQCFRVKKEQIYLLPVIRFGIARRLPPPPKCQGTPLWFSRKFFNLLGFFRGTLQIFSLEPSFRLSELNPTAPRIFIANVCSQ